ncbi:phosphotransferase [Cohnella boryungensis]|uniref:Phosphotransferase n=1 Tax=Cohnella boryungensis TaxID=768479 RepID=A0ABV8SKM9_9BACL
MSESMINPIAERFGIKISRKKKIRGGIYRIVTSKGKTFSLKRMPKRVGRLKWIDRILLRIQRNGSLVAWRNPNTPEGRKPYATSRKGEHYVLTPWISGRKPSPRSLSDMRRCGVALARFHKAGHAGIKGKIAYSRIGSWYSALRHREGYIKHKIVKARRNAFSLSNSRFIKQHGSEILRYSNRAKALLQGSGYYQYRRNPRKFGILCHGDGGPSNFIINSKGTYLIDFETVHVDLRAYDLYRVIYNSCKDYKWNFSIASAILDGYRQVSKLHKNDFKLLRALLRFPYTTYLVLSPFKRLPFTKRRLQWALESERKIGPFLKKLDEYAAKNCS